MNKVMTFGTFDRLHPGHISYLKQAREYGDYLVVVVARDNNVLKVKGKFPQENEKLRAEKLKLSKTVDKVILGDLENKYAVIKKEKPDIICLGYDQEVDLKELNKNFSGRIVRLKPFREDIYKSSIQRKTKAQKTISK